MLKEMKMNRREFVKASAATGALLMAANLPLVSAKEINPVELPKPLMDGGKPLMQCLKDRKTTRENGPDKIPLQVLSNLLWAAAGINRPEKGLRTVPWAHNMQNIDIYVATEDGVHIYDPKAHILKAHLAEDIRSFSAAQAAPLEIKAESVPLNLIYVADLDPITKSTRKVETSVAVSCIHTGLIVQNVCLFCSSEGLATVPRFRFDKKILENKLGLKTNHYITLVQNVGYPKK